MGDACFSAFFALGDGTGLAEASAGAAGLVLAAAGVAAFAGVVAGRFAVVFFFGGAEPALVTVSTSVPSASANARAASAESAV